jgi:O-antigen/teichoic acid export membrane protein
LLKTLLVNNAVLIIQYAVGGLIPLVLIPHIVKTIGLASYGDIAIGLSWMGYVSIVVQYAFQLTGPRYLVQSGRIKADGTVFWNIFAVKLLLFLLIGVAAVIYSVCFYDGAIPFSFIAIYSMLPFGSVFHSGWYLQALGHFITVSAVSISAAVVSLIIGFVLVQNPHHAGFAATSLVLGSLLSGIGTFLISVRITKKTPLTCSFSKVWIYMQEGWSVFLSQFIASLYMLSGPIIIGRLLDSSSAGAYSAVERIVTAVSSVCLLTHTAAYPKLAEFYHTDRPAYVRLMKAVLYIYFSLASLFCAVIAITSKHISEYIFGKDAHNYSILILWGGILILLAVFGPMVTGYFVISGQQGKVYPLTVKVLLLSLVLGIPGVMYFGIWAWFCSLAIAQSMVLWTGVQIARKRS